MPSTREVIATPSAPAAIGPYSQAILVTGARTLYTSGQIALDPATGTLVAPGDVRTQTLRVLDNLQAVLEAAGFTFANVAKAQIFLADMADFATVNELYAQRFPSAPPARSTVQVARLPKDALVEIDLVAVGD